MITLNGDAAPLSQMDVVMPILDSALSLPAVMAALQPGRACGLVASVIVVDGGSMDDGPALAEAAGAAVVRHQRGRGGQLARGAAESTAPWLLFLHADSVPDPGWIEAVRALMSGRAERAAAFRLRFDDPSRAARLVAAGANLRSRLFALPYGDQGLLIPRALYDAVGGFADMPLMEDVDMARRLGRGRLALLPCHVTTSAARYRRAGWAPRALRNLSILTLYFLGVSPARLARLYG